jgi:hypothetical protein
VLHTWSLRWKYIADARDLDIVTMALSAFADTRFHEPPNDQDHRAGGPTRMTVEKPETLNEANDVEKPET